MLDNDRALQIYLKNKDQFQGMPESEAISLIRRTAGILVGGAPGVTAPPVAAALAAAAPDPVPTAAPAPEAAPAPAPEAAPAPAPAPAPVYRNTQEAALDAYNLAYPETPAPVAVKGKPVDYADKARRDATERQRKELQADADTARTTKIDPEVQKVLDDRLLKYGAELAQVNPDKQRAIWMSVAQAGLKMAQSQSPYFIQALASGMEAGLEGYNEAKANAAEKKARLQDAKENLVLKSIDLRNQAIKDAVAARKEAKLAAAAGTALEAGSLGLLINKETAPEQIRTPGLENAYKQAVTSKVYKDMANDSRRLAIIERAARNPGGGGSFKTSDIKAAIAGAASDIRLIDKRLGDFINPPSSEVKKRLEARRNVNNETIRQGNSILSGKIGVSNNNPLGLNF